MYQIIMLHILNLHVIYQQYLNKAGKQKCAYTKTNLPLN